MSMITATAWVPRGYAASFPIKYQIDDEELSRISKLAKLNLEDAQEDLEATQNGDSTSAGAKEEDSDSDEAGVKIPRSTGDADDDLKEYDLDNYDSDPGDETTKTVQMLGGVKSLAYYENDEEDPYITLKDEEDEDEREELQVLATDNLVIAAKVEDEVAHLEVYVYEDEADNLYVHHDIMLPAIPLCVEWLDVPVGNSRSGGQYDQNSKGNFVAVGTFDPDIELWDLDTIDCMYPNAILGQGSYDNDTEAAEGKSEKKKKKKKKSKKANDNYHVDAVLSLASNRNHRTLLASCSADKTVKLWDLNTTKCAKSYSYHTDKVCSISWHPTETAVLLSGSYDRTIVAADMRAPDASVPRWGVESDVEVVKWNPHDPNFFYVTTESGVIHYHDVRVTPSSPEKSAPVWKLQAHDAAVSSFDVNPTIPGFLATGSADKEVKLWSVLPTGPSMVVSRNLGVGKVFSGTFAPDPAVAFRLAVAGSKGTIQIWDTSTNAAVRRTFTSRVGPSNGEVQERLIGIAGNGSDDDDESGSSDEEEGGQDRDGWESMEED